MKYPPSLDCSAYGTLEPQHRSYPEFPKELILRAYRERASMRGIERAFYIIRQTLARQLNEKSAILPDLVETLAPPVAPHLIVERP